MPVYLSLRDISRYVYSGPMSNRRVPQETYFPVSCLQEGRVCPSSILLSGKVKHFKNMLTKLVTHKRTLESERRKALIIINQMDSTNFRAKQNWRKSQDEKGSMLWRNRAQQKDT